LGAGEAPLVCKKKQRRKRRLGAVAPRLAVLRTGWAHTSQKFAWATCVLRQFRTLSAKQKISSLLFMLKSKEGILCFAEKVLNGRISYLHQAIFFAQMRFLTSFYPFPERHRRPLSVLPQSHLPAMRLHPRWLCRRGSRPDPPETWDARRFRVPFSRCPLRLPP